MTYLTPIQNDPYHLGSLFKIESKSGTSPMMEKTTLIATPIISTPQMMESQGEPVVSYIKITLDPSIQQLKIAIYCKKDNIQKISIGTESSTKFPHLAKRVLSQQSELAGSFQGIFLSYFPEEKHKKWVGTLFYVYDRLKDEEVPVICPTLLAMVVLGRKAGKWLNWMAS